MYIIAPIHVLDKAKDEWLFYNYLYASKKVMFS
jgi:hypothetical protein